MNRPRVQNGARRSLRRFLDLVRRKPSPAPSTPASGAATAPVAASVAVGSESARQTLADPDKQAELERYGFAVVDALDSDQLRLARELYADLGPAPDDPQLALNWSFHSLSTDYKRAVKEKVLPAFRQVIGGMLVDHEVYLTTFITKWPGPNSGFAPHQDPSLVDERFHRGVTVWIPLEDTGVVDGVDNGMLRFVPGSHRFSDALRVTDVDKSPVAGHEDAIIERHGVGMPTRAGQALVFDNRVIHYSMPNATRQPRNVLSFGVRPRECSCVLMREDAGTVRIYEIDDDFYIDVLPAENHRYQPPHGPIATIEQRRTEWTEEEFEALCRDVPFPPGAVRAGDTPTTWEDPEVFCALCGSSEGLGDADRSVRNNAQLICERCEGALAPRTSTTGP